MNAGRSERSLDVSVDQPQASYVSDFHSLATKQLNIYHINVQISNPNLTLKSQTFKIQIPNLMTKIVKSQPQIWTTNPNLKIPNPNQIPIPN